MGNLLLTTTSCQAQQVQEGNVHRGASQKQGGVTSKKLAVSLNRSQNCGLEVSQNSNIFLMYSKIEGLLVLFNNQDLIVDHLLYCTCHQCPSKLPRHYANKINKHIHQPRCQTLQVKPTKVQKHFVDQRNKSGWMCGMQKGFPNSTHTKFNIELRHSNQY